jgi:hypothetical protein
MGEPAFTRVDPRVDFAWDSFVTDTGKDYVSVRWSGYVSFPFAEAVTFFLQVNDGGRLVLDGVVLVDALESAAISDADVFEFNATTAAPLVADRLYPLTVEFRDNTGAAVARLLYASTTQAKTVVPSTRLFHGSTPIVGSPFAVTPVGAVAHAPQRPAAAVNSSSSLGVTWQPPADDGGEAVTAYRVEWWTAEPSPYETQTIVLTNVTGGTYTLQVPGIGTSQELDFNAPASYVQDALQRLPGVGNVVVVCAHWPAFPTRRCDGADAGAGGVAVYTVAFDSFVGDAATGDAALAGALVAAATAGRPLLGGGTLVVCAGGAGLPAPCVAGYSASGGAYADFCAPSASATNALAAHSSPCGLVDAADVDTGSLAYVIAGLTAGTRYYARVLAYTSAATGWGLATDAVDDVPRDVPGAPTDVGVILVAGAATSLKVYWSGPVEDNGDAVSAYTVQWSTDAGFAFTNGSAADPAASTGVAAARGGYV